MSKESNPGMVTWVGWLGATTVAAVTMVWIGLTFAYEKFETKEHAHESTATITRALERVEDKIDEMGEFPDNWESPKRKKKAGH